MYRKTTPGTKHGLENYKFHQQVIHNLEVVGNTSSPIQAVDPDLRGRLQDLTTPPQPGTIWGRGETSYTWDVTGIWQEVTYGFMRRQKQNSRTRKVYKYSVVGRLG